MFPNGYNYNIPFAPMYANASSNLGLRSAIGGIPRTGGLFSKLVGSRIFNWQGLLNNTSRALGVINQAIPIVKQVGPMYNNMKSMLKLASLFKDETDPVSPKNNTNNNNNGNTKSNTTNEEKENTITNNNYSNSPNFFI